MNDTLIQRTRDKKNQCNGLLMAKKLNGVVYLGWSKCNRMDEFNFERAKEIASGRIEVQNFNIPQSLQNKYNEFVDRCKRYFKNDIVLSAATSGQVV